jgi:hypothetical protein
MAYTEPALGQLAALLRGRPHDATGAGGVALAGATGAGIDLTVPAQREELRRWLNRWVCRLRYPLPGEPDLFASSVASWWQATGSGLPARPVEALSGEEIALLADGYADLAARPGALRTRRGIAVGERAIAPTAASKIMYVLRPETVPPWDAAIAKATVGGTSRDHFARHLTAARTWAGALLAEARRLRVDDIPAHVGRPGSSLARIRDEWMYLTITARHPVPQRDPYPLNCCAAGTTPAPGGQRPGSARSGRTSSS